MKKLLSAACIACFTLSLCVGCGDSGTTKKGTGMTDIWQFDRCPAPLSGDRDDGNLPFHFEPPATGGRLRIVQSDHKPVDYDPASDKHITPEHPPRITEGGTW